jgi:acyl-CoA reductase-like NAD-dependent aldehyde dehydrogenase
VNTLTLSGEEAKRHVGEIIPFDAYLGSETRQGWFDRQPLGIITAITPFNDPLNLVAHKLGPAIASGNAVLLKPSELAPLSALALVEALEEAGMPSEMVTVAIGGPELGREMVSSRDVRMISFTGGFKTGEAIAASAGLKKLSMDLGGNAPVVVMADCDLTKAVEACVSGAFWAAGQNCIGTQRILLQAPIADEFRDRFVQATKELTVGDPANVMTDVGPMITEQAAERALHMIHEAVQAGASLLCGGTREGTVLIPSVLEKVPVACRIWTEEAFAPLVVLDRFDTLDEAIQLANSPEYSLHAGVFTASLETALELTDKLEAAGVMINDSSDYRFDAMPFGGFKYGSLGREGVRFAIEEMSQSKTICINR